MRRLTAVLIALVATLLLATAAGCGSSDDAASAEAAATETVGTSTDAEEAEEEDEEHESATPEEAVEEIGEIRTLLAGAVDDYAAGNAEQAEETVGDVYLEHFESVEGPLGERDHELMEELEEAISTDLRNDMKVGKPTADIRASLTEIKGQLDEAVTALQAD